MYNQFLCRTKAARLLIIFSKSFYGSFDKHSGLKYKPPCLSAEFALRQTSLYCMQFCKMHNCVKKLFSQIDSLSALADTMKNFLTEQSRKALIFAAKSFYGSFYGFFEFVRCRLPEYYPICTDKKDFYFFVSINKYKPFCL